jgi:hypothetical protein
LARIGANPYQEARPSGASEELRTVTNPYARHYEKSKASFDHVYDLPDPRGYFETLGVLDYLTGSVG